MKRKLSNIFIRSFGRLSDGISLCLKEGIQSERTHDYICRKQPSGFGFIGRWIDKMFLNNPNWEALRMRQTNLVKVLIETINERNGARKMVSIASKPVSYVFSALEKTKRSDLQMLFQESTIFNELHPDIVIASSVYDTMDNGEMIKESIRSIFDALAPQGAFIFGMQTDRSEMSVAKEFFPDFDKITLRSADEMSEWLQAAGFRVEKKLRDPFGHYAVFKTKKPGNPC